MSRKLSPLPKRKFLKKLKNFGVDVVPGRGKGGEILLRQEETMEIVTLPHLSNGEDVDVPYIKLTLRVFEISRDDWFKAK
jgi:hypothetical protein